MESFHISELRHRSFSSSEWLVGILSPVVQPATALLVGDVADYFHCRTVGLKPVRDDRSRPTVTLHRALQKRQCSPAIPPFCCENLEHFAFMINGTPQIVRLPIDPHEHFVQVPAPVRVRMKMNPTLPDLRCKQRTEPVPPEPYCLVADVDATFGQQILDLSQRQWIADIHHHREADYLGRAVEITEGILHLRRLRNASPRLKPICSDNAPVLLAVA